MRRQDWPERLHDGLAARANQHFEWGSTDCLMTVSDLIRAMTDTDPAAAYRGQYSTELEALSVVKAAGCDSVEQLVQQIAAAHQYAEINPRLAQRGDLVIFDSAEGPAFGIVDLNARDGICAGPDGLRRLPVLTARRAWRI